MTDSHLNSMPLDRGLPWPAHPVPLKDECLTSWMHRLANANGRTFHGLCLATWAPSKKIYNLVLDKQAPDYLVETLHQRTLQPKDRIQALTFASLEGILFSGKLKSRTRWLLPDSRGMRVAGGLQFCPDCLASDPVPHYRLSWRLAFVTTCTVHKRTLLDACPSCAKPVVLTKPILEGPDPDADPAFTSCPTCGYDLKQAAGSDQGPASLTKEFERLGLALQRRMLRALDKGWMDIGGNGWIYSHLAFDGIHQIMKLLGGKRSSGPLAEAIKHAIHRDGVLPVSEWPQGQSFEYLPVKQRRQMMEVAAWLLENWPTRFVDTCQRAELRANHIQQDRKHNTPYWLAKVTNETLKMTHAIWRQPGQKNSNRSLSSYAQVGKQVMSCRLSDRVRKVLFIRANPHLTGDLRALASAMQQAGLYSLGSGLTCIARNLPKHVAAAKNPGSLLHIHGIHLTQAQVVSRPYNHPRGRAYMSIEDEKEFMASFWEAEGNGTPITAKAVRIALMAHLNRYVSEGAVYKFLKRAGWKPKK